MFKLFIIFINNLFFILIVLFQNQSFNNNNKTNEQFEMETFGQFQIIAFFFFYKFQIQLVDFLFDCEID